jgi:hypothetical protein
MERSLTGSAVAAVAAGAWPAALDALPGELRKHAVQEADKATPEGAERVFAAEATHALVATVDAAAERLAAGARARRGGGAPRVGARARREPADGPSDRRAALREMDHLELEGPEAEREVVLCGWRAVEAFLSDEELRPLCAVEAAAAADAALARETVELIAY